jgi:coniferyl-aldehyde dehydrogenase
MLRTRSVSKAAASFFSSAKVPLITQTKLIIDGKFVDAVDGQTFDTLDPRTGNLIAKIASAGVEDVNRAVAAARNAFDNGTSKPRRS